MLPKITPKALEHLYYKTHVPASRAMNRSSDLKARQETNVTDQSYISLKQEGNRGYGTPRMHAEARKNITLPLCNRDGTESSSHFFASPAGHNAVTQARSR